MRLVYHSFMAQKRNIMFWVNCLFVLFSSGIISYNVFHQGDTIRGYWIWWGWIWSFPAAEDGRAGGGIYSYLPLNLQDKKKIFLNDILMMYFILCFAQLILYIIVLCCHRNAIYILCSTSGWLLSVILFLNVIMLVTTKCKVECYSVSKRVTNISIIGVILCMVMLLFPDYKIGESIGYWVFVGIYFLAAIIFIVLIWVSYLDYIPKDSLDVYSKEKKS